jgi:HlyD family secretion protein
MKWLNGRPLRREPTPDQLIRMFQSETAEIRDAPGPVRAQLVLLLLAAMFASLLIIAAVFKVDRTVTSSFGQMVTAEPTIVLQALDPSIIKTIEVREGDKVRAGQLLATLDATFTGADVNALRMQIASLDAQIARCEAELGGRPLSFSGDGQPGGKLYETLQQSYYHQRKAQFDSQVRAFDEVIAQSKATMLRLEADQRLYDDRSKANKELEDIRSVLAVKELGSRVQFLQTLDQRLEVERLMATDRNGLVETQHQLEATISTRDSFIQQWSAQTTQELLTARNQRDSALQQLDKAEKHQELVSLKAPQDAVILRMARLSVGSVLQQGDAFIELAPLRSAVEAEVYVSPRDVGFIRQGDKATIKLDPYQFVEHGWVSGKVEWISAGTFTASQMGTGGAINAAGTSPGGSGGIGSGAASTMNHDSSLQQLGSPFYKARISIGRVEMRNVPDDFRLMPGMTLTADINVGRRSLFWYLMRGIVRSVDEAMREP